MDVPLWNSMWRKLMCVFGWFYWNPPLLTKSTHCAIPQFCMHKCLVCGLGTSWSVLKIIFSLIMLVSIHPLVFQEVFEKDGESRRAKLYERQNVEEPQEIELMECITNVLIIIFSLFYSFAVSSSLCVKTWECAFISLIIFIMEHRCSISKTKVMKAWIVFFCYW